MSKTTLGAALIGLGLGLVLTLVLYLTGAFGDGEPPALPATAQRVVVFGPNITDTIAALGRGDRLAGTTRRADVRPRGPDAMLRA